MWVECSVTIFPPSNEESASNESIDPEQVYECMQIEDPVFLHGDSVLFKDQPPWVVFQEVTEDTKDKMQLRYGTFKKP